METTPAESKKLIVGELFSQSFTFFKTHYKKLIAFFLVLLIPQLVAVIFQLIMQAIPGATLPGTTANEVHFAYPRNIVNAIVSFIVSIASIYIGLGLLKGLIAMWKDEIFPKVSIYCKTTARQVIYMIIASIIVGILSLIGLALFVIPGIYVIARLQFYKYFVAQGLCPFKSIGASWKLTKNNGWRVIVMNLGILGLALLVALGIGIIAGIFFLVKIAIVGAIIGAIAAVIGLFWVASIGGLVITKAYLSLNPDPFLVKK